ncbi:hypothetical protein ACQP3F_30480, partial [Escherichia coli]
LPYTFYYIDSEDPSSGSQGFTQAVHPLGHHPSKIFFSLELFSRYFFTGTETKKERIVIDKIILIIAILV